MKVIPDQEYFENRKWGKIPSKIVNSIVKEVLYIASNNLNRQVKDLKILDVGCGTGEYAIEFAKYVKKVVGVEPYKKTYKIACENKRKSYSKAIFVNKLIENYESLERFDLVISLATVEHMPNVELSFWKVFELLKTGGLIYLTAPNKLWPYEHHYRLPFLSWIPLSLANLYVKVTGRGTSYEDSAYSRTYFGMRRLFDKFSCTYSFRLPSNLNSAYIGCGETGRIYTFIKKAGIQIIKRFPFFWIFSKGFLMVIRKDPFYMDRLYYYDLAFERLNKGGNRWLDLGCGRGEFIGNLMEDSERHGYDVDPEKIKEAKKNYKNVNFSLGGGGEKLPYKSNYFDKVFLFHVLEHVDSEEETIKEVYRVLKKGGTLYLASPYKGLFSWADAANLRYYSLFLHKILGGMFYGKKKYTQLFEGNLKNGLLGDSSIKRRWHKHYKEKEVKKLLSQDFRIEEFLKYSLFQPFLLDLVNLYKFIFKKESKFIDRLVWIDNKIKAGDFSYNMFIVARKNV